MKSFFLTLCLIVFAFKTQAQTSHVQPTDSFASIHDLSFMIGEWKGEGWIMINRERKTFTQTETIRPKMDSLILIVDGLGYSKEEVDGKKKVIHNAFGVISFDEESKSVKMLSYATTGGRRELELVRLGERKLYWAFKDEQGGTIRFTDDISNPGEWREKGEYSPDGQRWFQFFEMTLIKQ